MSSVGEVYGHGAHQITSALARPDSANGEPLVGLGCGVASVGSTYGYSRSAPTAATSGISDV